jgi:hypothetical protein
MGGKLLVDLFAAAIMFLARNMRVLNQKHLCGWDGSLSSFPCYLSANICILKKMYDYYNYIIV